MKLNVYAANKVRKCKLHDVLYVPDLSFNLVSVSKAVKAGKKIEFDRTGCQFIDKSSNEIIVSAKKLGNLYYINCTEKVEKRRKGYTHGKSMFQAEKIESALLCLKEDNFEENMMRRLNTISRNDHGRRNCTFENDKISNDCTIEEDPKNDGDNDKNEAQKDDLKDDRQQQVKIESSNVGRVNFGKHDAIEHGSSKVSTTNESTKKERKTVTKQFGHKLISKFRKVFK